ncbi:hypothetical protein NN561_008788 [Cricetulus griseus]
MTCGAECLGLSIKTPSPGRTAGWRAQPTPGDPCAQSGKGAEREWTRDNLHFVRGRDRKAVHRDTTLYNLNHRLGFASLRLGSAGAQAGRVRPASERACGERCCGRGVPGVADMLRQHRGAPGARSSAASLLAACARRHGRAKRPCGSLPSHQVSPSF